MKLADKQAGMIEPQKRPAGRPPGGRNREINLPIGPYVAGLVKDDEPMMDAIFACERCSEPRVYGNARPRASAQPRIRCAACKAVTAHWFREMRYHEAVPAHLLRNEREEGRRSVTT